MVGRAWQCEHEAAGYTVPAVRKQSVENAGAQLSSSLCSLQDLSPQDAVALFTVCLFQVNSKRHAWKFVSYVILDLVKLAIDKNPSCI